MASTYANTHKTQLLFGVVPQQSPQKLAATWGPLLNEVSEQTGVDLVFATAKDIPTFEKNVSDGVYDIAYMNPYHYVEFSKAPGYRAIVKQMGKKIRGIIVISKRGDVSSLKDLQNKSIAFPAPAAFAASIIPQSFLERVKIEYQPVYVSSHDSVYMNVARGFLPAGGGIIRTLNALPDNIRNELDIMWQSDAFSPHAIAVHPRLSNMEHERLRQGFLSINGNKYQSVLSAINFKGFESAEDDNWNDVRTLDISHQLNR
jgi:phosphonate transport system substrate-binding protein